MKMKKLGAFFAAFLLVSSFFIPVFALSSPAATPVVAATPNTQNIIKISGSDPQVHEYFNQIAATKYDVQTNNCKTKSEQFANYLVQNGATDVYTVEVQQASGNIGHEYIQWQGKVYDPTFPVYGMSQTEYDKILTSHGLTGLKFIKQV
ncbi:MAG: hypothetical protein HZC47_01130 [Methanobacterium sp.]|uniref:hypothetical protein n=1 Tax=Methanobacterium sp. TaxID=2164 RepID=UPI003D65D706|nr:hypothetical protein [Methanobacterium sp.]